MNLLQGHAMHRGFRLSQASKDRDGPFLLPLAQRRLTDPLLDLGKVAMLFLVLGRNPYRRPGYSSSFLTTKLDADWDSEGLDGRPNPFRISPGVYQGPQHHVPADPTKAIDVTDSHFSHPSSMNSFYGARRYQQ
jgi:hypothetical protein